MAEKKKGFLKRLFDGMAKTRHSLVSKLDSIFSGKIDDDFYDELEEILITADIGVHTTNDIIESLRERVEEEKLKDPAVIKDILIQSIKDKMYLGENAYDFETQKSVVLVIGVNGVGKTTSIGKLAGQMVSNGKKVILAAADTFRAGAIEQLGTWAQRSGAGIVAHQEGSDPAAVIYDAVASAKAKNADILICDTAGRLHNKKNLMEELKKINRIIDKDYPEAFRETLIVLDGTTGQNALVQAREFMECANITGIILTKMDGTAKGGIAVAIQSELGIPVKYIGVGEQIDDLQKFDAKTYVDALFTEADITEEESDVEIVSVPETVKNEAVSEPEAAFKPEITSEPENAPSKESDITKIAAEEKAAENEETISSETEDDSETALIVPEELFKIFSSDFFKSEKTWDLLTECYVDEDSFNIDTFDFDKYSFK